MRVALFALCMFLALTGNLFAAEFPGPKVRDEAPFNKSNVISGGALSCPKIYERGQLVTDRRAIVADIASCVRSSFGIAKDIGLAFGEPRTPHAECVIPSTYDARPPSNNPMWPVCCPVQLPNGKYRMACRLFFTSK